MAINVSSYREFEQHTKSAHGRPAIVDFTAAWCGPCKAIAPIFEQLARQYAGKITFLKVDVDSQQDIARECGVTAMPTFVLFAKGRQQESVRGADPSALEALLRKYEGFQPVFSGTGHKLSAEPRPAAAAAAPTPTAAGLYTVDEARPATSLQIRMSDGNRLVARFNTSSTIGDLKRHIRAANPAGPASFTLMAGVPVPKPLSLDDSATLEAAGLLNSVVIQRA